MKWFRQHSTLLHFLHSVLRKTLESCFISCSRYFPSLPNSKIYRGHEIVTARQRWRHLISLLLCRDRTTPQHYKVSNGNTNSVNKTNLVHSFTLSIFINIYMFRATICPSSEKNNYVFCDTWYLVFCVDDCLVCTLEWHKNTVVSPDDGHIVARNM